jgi:riboflavin kinase/FMN adenylyltransferase
MSSMKILNGLDGLKQLPPRSVLSIGNFDGVHLGHRRIISTAQSYAANTSPVALVTFEPHPLTVLHPNNVPPRLTPLSIKNELLANAGIDYLVELPPTQEILNTTAEDFFAILRDHVRPSHMIEGENFNFGKARQGTIHKLREWTASTDIQLHVIDPVSATLCDYTIAPVSSSLIRWLLSNGRVRDASRCLGRPYTLEGVVIPGFQRGRTIGTPTANLNLTSPQLLPPDAVYAAQCTVAGTTYPTAVSLGNLPTLGANLPHQLEAHLIGFTGDLYGQTLRVDLLDYLREQYKLPSLNHLKLQIARDLRTTAALYT